MADLFPEPEHRISVYTVIKLLFFNWLSSSCFTNLHKITHLKLIIHLISQSCVFRPQIRRTVKLKKNEFLFILFSSCIAVHLEDWHGLAVSFVKIQRKIFSDMKPQAGAVQCRFGLSSVYFPFSRLLHIKTNVQISGRVKP